MKTLILIQLVLFAFITGCNKADMRDNRHKNGLITAKINGNLIRLEYNEFYRCSFDTCTEINSSQGSYNIFFRLPSIRFKFRDSIPLNQRVLVGDTSFALRFNYFESQENFSSAYGFIQVTSKNPHNGTFGFIANPIPNLTDTLRVTEGTIVNVREQ